MISIKILYNLALLCFFLKFSNQTIPNPVIERAQLQGQSGRGTGRLTPKRPFTQGRTSAVTGDEDESNCLKLVVCPSFFEQRFATIDGSCNNRVNTKRGSVDRSFRRLLSPVYSNIDQPRLGSRGRPLATARSISNALQDAVPSVSNRTTQMLPLLGQFIAHDLTLTLSLSEEEVSCPCFGQSSTCLNIPIAPGDQQFSLSKKCFKVIRSTWVANSDDCNTDVRQQGNELTGYLDMGVIYGTSEAQITALRETSAGKPGELIDQEPDFAPAGKLLPQIGDSENLQAAADNIFCPRRLIRPEGFPCFVSGEPRTNENSVLTSHHTIWLRLHNTVVRGLKAVNPTWTSDQLFNNARSIVLALEQRVIYTHFLPLLIGPRLTFQFDLNLLSNGYWYGYDSSFDATLINSFSAAAFRMGHPLINKFFTRPDPSWTRPQGPSIRVKDALNNPGVVAGNVSGTERAGGPNSFIRGLAAEPSFNFDTTFSDDLRNFLDAEPGQFGSDLLSRNIQRGRDHGLPPYLYYRAFCGLFVPKSFFEMSQIMSATNVLRLQRQYRSVLDIDLFAGGISENTLDNGILGPTFACIIGHQFRDARSGDRFWHENPPPFGTFSKEQLESIRQYEFPRILCDVILDMRTIQPWPLKQVSQYNLRRACSSYTTLDFTPWKENKKINLTNEVIKQDTEWTTWFPLDVETHTYLTETLTVSEAYDWLLISRPDDVCRKVLKSETRTVQSRRLLRSQVRFECLPGTIKRSEFPRVPSDKYVWTNWARSDLVVASGNGQCLRPLAIQAQTRPQYGVTVPAGATGEVFSDFSPRFGFNCNDHDQIDQDCETYYVRFLCRKR